MGNTLLESMANCFSNLESPPKGSPLVSNWIDEGFWPQIFQWDTNFMTMFGRYANNIFPFINSQDNFYAAQHQNGMICRVINESDGSDHEWGLGHNFARTITHHFLLGQKWKPINLRVTKRVYHSFYQF